MPYPVEGFLEINEVIVQILLMLELLFTQISEVEALSAACSSVIINSASGLSLFKMIFSMALLE